MSIKRVASLCLVAALCFTACKKSNETKSEIRRVRKPDAVFETKSESRNGALVHVSKLSEITDKQLKTLKEAAESVFEDNVARNLPSNVSLDECRYVGNIIQNASSPEYEGWDYVYMVFQVQVTDKSGTEPVVRRFFWTVGYSDVYLGGTVDTGIATGYATSVCFPDWSINGFRTFDTMKEEMFTNFAGAKFEVNVDESLFMPEIGPAEDTTRQRVATKEEVTPVQIKLLNEEARVFFDYEQELKSDFVVVEQFKYIGLIVVSNSYGENNVYMCYQVRVIDHNQEPPKAEEFYWCDGFPNVYTNGEVDPSTVNSPDKEMLAFSGWSVNGFSSVEDMKKSIIAYWKDSVGMTFSDGIDTSLLNPGGTTKKDVAIVVGSNDGFVFPSSDKELIPKENIQKLSDGELRAAINEIWARHGYIFRNKEILDKYHQFSWYEEKVPADEWDKNGEDHYLNEIEQKNIKNLVDERDKRGG